MTADARYQDNAAHSNPTAPHVPSTCRDQRTCASLKIARAPFLIAAALRETQSTLESNIKQTPHRHPTDGYLRRSEITKSTRTPCVASHVPGYTVNNKKRHAAAFSPRYLSYCYTHPTSVQYSWTVRIALVYSTVS